MSNIFEQYPKLLDIMYVEAYDFSDCWTVINPDRAFSVLDVAAAILKYEGNLSTIALALQRGRRQTETFIARNLELRELSEDVEEAFMDDIEEAYKKSAKAGDPGARRFFLMTKGKSRGYVTRVESTGKDGGAIEVDQVDARSVLADRVNQLLVRRGAAATLQANAPSGSGGDALGLEDVGETGTTSPDGQGMGDVAGDGGSGVREDADRSGVDT